MRVLVHADQTNQAHEWRDMLQTYGHTVTVLPLGVHAETSDWDVCVVLNGDPAELFSYRFWLAQLTVPTLLITKALTPAQVLCRHVSSLRLVCHPSRAVQHLSDLLPMTCEVRAGVIILGPIPTVRAECGFGGTYAIN